MTGDRVNIRKINSFVSLFFSLVLFSVIEPTFIATRLIFQEQKNVALFCRASQIRQTNRESGCALVFAFGNQLSKKVSGMSEQTIIKE